MENRSDIISIEALKSEAPEEFAIQEGDDKYEITKKQLDYELDKRMKYVVQDFKIVKPINT